MQKAAELINLAPNDDVGPRIIIKVVTVILDLLLEGIGLLGQGFDRVTQSEDLEEVSLLSELLLRSYTPF